MSIVSQTMLDSLFGGYFTQKRTVPTEEDLRRMAADSGQAVEQLKDAFAAKWRAAGNLDDPFGRNPPEDEDDEQGT
jgi:hypothetical protein